jgi:hypothetical protein
MYFQNILSETVIIFWTSYITYPPVSLQSFWARSLVGGNFLSSAVQNQPLISTGCRSGLSQPLKSQSRPLVQIYFTLPASRIMKLCTYYNLHIQWMSIHWLEAFQQELSRRLAGPGQTEATKNTWSFQQVSNRQRDSCKDTLSEEPRN